MQIEIKDTEYEISEPKKNNFFQRLEQIQPWVEKYGGWKLISGICAVAFFTVFFLPSVPGQILSEDQKTSLWGSNFYQIIITSGNYYRWITANFLHFGFLHITFNLLAAYMFGTFLEKIWNAKIFFLLFILSGILANVGTFLISQGNSAGASGGVFGLMGALLAFFLWSKDLDPGARLFMLKQIGVLVFINVILGLVIPKIDLIGHLSGFAAGLGLGKILTRVNLKKRPRLLFFLWAAGVLAVIYSFTMATIDYIKADSI